MALGYFQNNPDQGKQIEIKIVGRRPKDKPYGDLMMPLIGEVTQARMQDPGPGGDPGPARGRTHAAAPAAGTGPLGAPGSLPFGSPNPFSPPPDTMPPDRGSLAGAPLAARWWRRSLRGRTRPPPVGAGEPPGTFPSIPGMNMTDVGPTYRSVSQSFRSQTL